jgi:hypothetical protein
MTTEARREMKRQWLIRSVARDKATRRMHPRRGMWMDVVVGLPITAAVAGLFWTFFAGW